MLSQHQTYLTEYALAFISRQIKDGKGEGKLFAQAENVIYEGYWQVREDSMILSQCMPEKKSNNSTMCTGGDYHKFEPRFDIVEKPDREAIKSLESMMKSTYDVSGESAVIEQIKHAYTHEKKYLFDICTHCGEKRFRPV